MGSSYVNDFMDRGRVKKVYVRAAAKYRMLPDDINLWYVRNSSGTMVPFSAFATSRWETGSPRLERYNGYSAVEIVGEAAPGISTGTAMDMMEKLAAQLPTGFGLEWTAMSYQNASLALRRRPCTRFLCWWCSCARRRCTRVGQCRSR